MEKRHTVYKRRVVGISVLCTIIAVALGVLVHLISRWSLHTLAGAFLMSSESVWEHLKMLLIPVFILTIIEYAIYGKRYGSFFFSRLRATLLGLVVMLMMYYTFVGALGVDYLSVDAAILVSATFLVYFISTSSVFKKGQSERPERREIASVLIFSGVILLVFALPHAGIDLPIFDQLIKHKSLI